jgi:hypothetical protein
MVNLVAPGMVPQLYIIIIHVKQIDPVLLLFNGMQESGAMPEVIRLFVDVEFVESADGDFVCHSGAFVSVVTPMYQQSCLAGHSFLAKPSFYGAKKPICKVKRSPLIS